MTPVTRTESDAHKGHTANEMKKKLLQNINIIVFIGMIPFPPFHTLNRSIIITRIKKIKKIPGGISSPLMFVDAIHRHSIHVASNLKKSVNKR